MLRAALAFALVAACGASPPAPAPAPPPPVGDRGVDTANLESQLGAYVASVGAGDPDAAFSGFVLVAQHGQPIFSHAYGLADRTTQRVASADTSFRIGSVTKQFTATAILRLEQDGKLRVADKVSAILPDYRGPAKDVTIHQLLTHTAGIPNFTDDPGYSALQARPHSPAQLLALFAEKPLEFAPGTKFAYSNSGYVLLGAIIEKASGTTYGDYLRDTLFIPAGMTRTVVGDAPTAPDRALGYMLGEEGRIVPADPVDMSVPFAAGAVRSTANDLVRWHRAITGDTILAPAARAKLYQPALEQYAYGWIVFEQDGRRMYTHGGGIDGFQTTYTRFPESDVVIVGWSNNVAIAEVGRAAIQATFGAKVTPVPKVEKGVVDPTVTARLAGSFALTAESRAAATAAGLPEAVLTTIVSIEVAAVATGITVKPVGQDRISMIPLADGAFWAAGPRARITFALPASGSVDELALTQGSLRLTYRRAAR